MKLLKKQLNLFQNCTYTLDNLVRHITVIYLINKVELGKPQTKIIPPVIYDYLGCPLFVIFYIRRLCSSRNNWHSI